MKESMPLETYEKPEIKRVDTNTNTNTSVVMMSPFGGPPIPTIILLVGRPITVGF